ncbi:site-specific integrase [uncultured Thioclava sp.]|uniref:tyrosine-type recombinase/integrase n=1 Tax=uncultured Thioclava sp. TaxID=473858 RepID=UPI0025DD0BAC|nr:site-specific integrase [uncultured Thioclava sp.]
MFDSEKTRKGKPLTAAFVRNIKEPGKYHDGNGTGLFLRVDKTGGKFWVQRITFGGKRHELGVGSPPVVSLAEAREKAFENKRLVRLGGNPLTEKRKVHAEALNFAQVVEKYLDAKLSEFRSEKHRKQWRSTLDTYAVPVIGTYPISQIAPADVLRVLEPIWETKTETATRLRQRIEAVFSWAIASELRETENPARWKGNLSEMLPKPSKVKSAQNFPALSLKDAPRWWAALSARDGMAARALQFACLTASRSGEVRGMTWDEVDLDAALWVIPAERMKARREHREPLTNGAVSLLTGLPRLERSPYVFFAPQGGMLSDMSISAVMRRMQEAEAKADQPGFIDTRSGRPAVPHGLRSTFRDWAAEADENDILAELALAHKPGSAVERAYRRSDMLDRRRRMMARWEQFLLKGSPLDR